MFLLKKIQLEENCFNFIKKQKTDIRLKYLLKVYDRFNRHIVGLYAS